MAVSALSDVISSMKIAEIKLVNTSYARTGGYNADVVSRALPNYYEKPRPTSVKGVWRWWLRALVAGVLWSSHGYVTLDKCRNIVSSILGSTDEPSRILLHLDCYTKGGPRQVYDPIVRGIPRLRLLSMGGKKGRRPIYAYIPGALSVVLSLYRDPLRELSKDRGLSPDEVKAAVGSLLISLVFGGIGAITRRGFGSIGIEYARSQHGYNYLTPLLRAATRIFWARNEAEIEENIRKILKTTYESVERLVGGEKRGVLKGVPPIPALVPDSNVFRFQVVPLRVGRQERALALIGKATLKASWRGSRKLPNRKLHTWILGLPRGVKKLGTGYAFAHTYSDEMEDMGRHTSSIGISLISTRQKKLYGLVYGFLSSDWLSYSEDIVLKHFSGIEEPEEVSRIPIIDPSSSDPRKEYAFSIEKAFDVAFRMVVHILRGDQGVTC